MTSTFNQLPNDLFGVAHIEEELMAALALANREMAHTDFSDDEQRAEIYSILDAIKTDTRAHREIVGVWVNQRTGEASRA